MRMKTKIGLITVLALLLWTPAAAASTDGSGANTGSDLIAQEADDDDDMNDDDWDNGDDLDDDHDTEQPGVPDTGFGGAASTGSGATTGGDLLAQEADDDDMSDDAWDDRDDDQDAEQPGVPDTGAGGVAAAGGTSILLMGGMLAFLSAFAAGVVGIFRRS